MRNNVLDMLIEFGNMTTYDEKKDFISEWTKMSLDKQIDQDEDDVFNKILDNDYSLKEIYLKVLLELLEDHGVKDKFFNDNFKESIIILGDFDFEHDNFDELNKRVLSSSFKTQLNFLNYIIDYHLNLTDSNQKNKNIEKFIAQRIFDKHRNIIMNDLNLE